MKDFRYSTPATLGEAMALLEEEGTKAFPLAGGTDLLVQMRRGRAQPDHLVDLKAIPGIRHVVEENSPMLKIGALSSLSSLGKSLSTFPTHRLIAEAAASIGSVQVRNKGTLGGNLCNASPSADMAPPLLVLDARVVIDSPRGRRTLPLQDFFQGPGKTVLARGEILREIQIPFPPAGAGAVYLKLSRRRGMDLAIVGVACLLSLDPESRVRRVHIALGAVAPTPIRAAKAEEALLGEKVSDRLIEEVSRVAVEESRPISDLRASAEYRREMIRVLVRRSLEISGERAQTFVTRGNR